ncbi:lipase [Mucor mucedo]|uniref:lipase n=1 Tax=Mucor mucedo TaxID=29922 RepID=UPI00221E5A87|nr:lipase [Mucor mucedo]KAI7892786.1 lipase [Mucor mucedo]
MVSFTSITSGIILISVMIIGSSKAAPTAPTAPYIAPHTNATSTASFTLPPIISSRVKPVSNPDFAINLNAEAQNIAKNKKWFEEHGGSYKNVTKRASETVGGMTMDLPTNAPPVNVVPSSTVITASAAQIATFKNFAGIASTAYCRSVVPLGIWSCKNCLKFAPDGKLLVTFSSLLADTNGFVLRSDSQKTIHLVFRGTNSIRSSITDMVLIKRSYPPVSGAEVHTGFYASFQEVLKTYFPVVQEQLTTYPSYKVVVSGHSLGGAQAVLAALDLYQRDKRLTGKNLSVYTVGGPRIGNPAFAYYVSSTGIPITRSVNDRDIVPHVPPQSSGFLHPGVEAWSRSSTNTYICTDNIETSECSNSIVPFTSFTDHLTYYDINEGLCL